MTLTNAKERKEGIFFLWTVVNPQRYPLKRVALNVWVPCRKTFMKVWFLKKIATQWTGSLEKLNLLFRLLRNFSEVKSGKERRELQSHIIGRTLGTSIYVWKVIFIFSSVYFAISEIFKIGFSLSRDRNCVQGSQLGMYGRNGANSGQV